METIMKVIGFFVGFFVIANGIWVVTMPPTGDEPIGYAVVAIGIFIPVMVLYVARLEDQRET